MTTDCLPHQVRESTGREDGAEATKIGEVPKDTSVRIMETIVLSDGTEKALISKDGVVASAYGWIVTKIPGKAKGEEDQNLLVPATPLPISFDLAVHTANSLMRVLSGKAGKGTSVIKRRKDGEGLPSAVAGKRPKFGDQDGPTTSRHAVVTEPATLKMVFNCFNAPFAVTSWTGKQHLFEPLREDSTRSEHASAHHGAVRSSPQVRNTHLRNFHSKCRSICSSSRIARRRLGV